jgi:ferric-dicitrate binding protein FerR (iron transport regulator)
MSDQRKAQVERRARLEEAARWLLEMDQDDTDSVSSLDPVAFRDWYQNKDNEREFDGLASFVNEVRDARPNLTTPYDGGSDEAVANEADGFLRLDGQSPSHFAWLRGQNGRRGFTVAWGVVAAIVAVACALTALETIHPWYRTRADRTPQVTYETGSAEQKTISLQDGSVMVLGAVSKVTMDLTNQTRTVALERGEALFKVARDPHRPFVVLAGRGSIRALGTEFNVLREAERVVVTVSEGSVLVAPSDPGSPTPATQNDTSSQAQWLPTAVKPGQQITYEQDGRASAIEHADPKVATAWTTGRLQYLRQPLREVIADVNRYWGPQLNIDPEAGAFLYTGDVPQSDIESWARNLPQIFPVTVSDSDPQHVVIRLRPDMQRP